MQLYFFYLSDAHQTLFGYYTHDSRLLANLWRNQFKYTIIINPCKYEYSAENTEAHLIGTIIIITQVTYFETNF